MTRISAPQAHHNAGSADAAEARGGRAPPGEDRALSLEGGDPAESSSIISNTNTNTKRNHQHQSKNKNSERASTNLLSAQGYVKDERDDPHYSQKARRGREKVAEQLLRDMREESHSGERKSRRHHHRHGGGGAQISGRIRTGRPDGRPPWSGRCGGGRLASRHG